MLSLKEEDEQWEREGKYLEDLLSKKQKMSVEDDDDNQQGEGKEQEKLDDEEDNENEHDRDKEDQDEEQTEEAKSITTRLWRCSTKEEKRNYNIMVKNSKGFDVGDVPENVYDLPIRPVRLDLFPNNLKNLEKRSKAALEN